MLTLLKDFDDKVIVSLPQSLKYKGVPDDVLVEYKGRPMKKMLAHAFILGKAVERCHSLGCRLIFMWRQESSLAIARVIYPFATNLLVPDIAFSLGPFIPEFSDSIRPEERVDILLLKREDMEANTTRGVSRHALGAIIQSHLAKLQHASGRMRKYSFRVADWGDSREDFAPLGDKRCRAHNQLMLRYDAPSPCCVEPWRRRTVIPLWSDRFDTLCD
ncbi:hypothetical protein T492DRAFT_976909 [Pavlovales sp. CCMP2436]|nr:hypothetical protein T492DRAFT_976909 [Pavlovales sp. CCMP2436]